MRPAYFQYLDQLVHILHQHQIAPILQPVFHGYGWKGLRVAGRTIPGDQYARYCRYLVARYGAAPAIYLVGADGYGKDPGVRPGGFALCSKEVPLYYRVCDASTGEVLRQDARKESEMRIDTPAGRPIVVVFHN